MKNSVSLIVLTLFIFSINGCFSTKNDAFQESPTPPPTAKDYDSPLTDIDPDYEPKPQTAEATPRIEKPLTPIQLMSPAKKKKYNDLQREKEYYEDAIYSAKKDRLDADMKIIKILQGAPDRYGNTGSFVDPEAAIKHERWRKKDSDYVIDESKKKIQTIDRKVSDLLKEGSDSCFPEDTPILMADGNYKAIQKIKIGDKVKIFDIGNNTLSTSVVENTMQDQNNHLYIINRTIKATAFERFLTQDKGWKKIREIKIGDRIFSNKEYVEVVSKKRIRKDMTVYNLTIKHSHNFFVVTPNGLESFLVHNSGGGSGGSSGGGK